MSRVYIAGPMTSFPHYNVAAFMAAKADWEREGWEVVTPFDTNSVVWTRHYGRPFDPFADKCDYGDPVLGEMLLEDFRALIEADGVAFLRGWEKSKGATMEHGLAALLGKPMYDAATFLTLASDEKPTNPKDAIGSDKMPLHLWPTTATIHGCLALLDGACKYGRQNFRAIGVRASIYYDAARRHLDAWYEGEDAAPDSGVHHLGHVLACAAIILDADAAGKLNDDRAVAGGYHKLLADLTPLVAQIKARHADKSPKHYSIADTP